MEARDFVVELQGWGLTQAQIAERSGVPQPTISKIFRGEVEDVLSRNYRSLQAVHAEESQRQAKAVADAESGQVQLELVDRREQVLPIGFADRRAAAQRAG